MTFLLKGKMTPILNPNPLRSSYKLKFMEMTCWKITIVIILRKWMKYSLYWLHILSIKRFLLKISLSDKEIATHRFGWIEMFFFLWGGTTVAWYDSGPVPYVGCAVCCCWLSQCSKGLSRVLRFSFLRKTQRSKFEFDQDGGQARTPAKPDVAFSVNSINLFCLLESVEWKEGKVSCLSKVETTIGRQCWRWWRWWGRRHGGKIQPSSKRLGWRQGKRNGQHLWLLGRASDQSIPRTPTSTS